MYERLQKFPSAAKAASYLLPLTDGLKLIPFKAK
jgi:hypothetical protein